HGDSKYYTHFIQLVELLQCCLQFEYSSNDIEKIRAGFAEWITKYEEYYYQHDPSHLSTCPLTVHAILHIIDCIVTCGLVWAYWAFPMECYCSVLAWEIHSRRFPFTNLDRFILDTAQMYQIKLLYSLQSVLSFSYQKAAPRASFLHPSYPSCMLLAPHQDAYLNPLNANDYLTKKVLNHLALRFNTDASVIQPHLPRHILDYGRIRKVDSEARDTMLAVQVVKKASDGHDVTFIQYQMYVDKYRNNRRRAPEFILTTFYGQLQHILVIELPAIPALSLTKPETFILAVVRQCNIESIFSPLLDMHEFSKLGPDEVVDATTLQCLVSHIPLKNKWVIIDRSGGLVRAATEIGEN
ncbi:hypothetical protein ABKN59_010252, partial [Abortiporus biennis]